MQLTRRRWGKVQCGQRGLGLSTSLTGLQEEASLSLYLIRATRPSCFTGLGWFWPESEFWNQFPVFFHKNMHFFFVSGTTKEIYAWGASGMKGPFLDESCLRKCRAMDFPDGLFGAPLAWLQFTSAFILRV